MNEYKEDNAFEIIEVLENVAVLYKRGKGEERSI